jgi:hypothetical protein
MFLKVTRVEPLDGYRLRIDFNDRTVNEVDLREHLFGEAFEPLKQPEYFRQVVVNPETETIEWPNGADFAPEFLKSIGTEIRRSA